MRTDPKLHFEHGDELVEASEGRAGRGPRPRWRDWFEVVPQAPCAVAGHD